MAISEIKHFSVLSMKTPTKVEFSELVKHLIGSNEAFPFKLVTDPSLVLWLTVMAKFLSAC